MNRAGVWVRDGEMKPSAPVTQGGRQTRSPRRLARILSLPPLSLLNSRCQNFLQSFKRGLLVKTYVVCT